MKVELPVLDRPTINNPHTRGIANYVAGLRYEAIPTEVRERLKLLILDSIGCGIYAAHLPWSRILIDALGGVDSSAACTVWGATERTSAPHAALINGSLIQGYEIDDVFHRGPTHVGAVVLPSLFAALETVPAMTGQQFLTAALAGYEVAPRAALCMGPEHLGRGWHSGATTGVFGAAAAAAAAFGLNEEQSINALGIAGTQAAGLMAAQYGAMVKRMHAGRSAQSGFYGALLARNGFTGISNVFESEYGGFCSAFGNGPGSYDLAELTRGFGAVYHTMDVQLKFYACVGGVHNTLDAIRLLREQRPFTADEVDAVTVDVSQISLDHSGWKYKPEGVTSAQLNMSYCLATMLLEGDVFVDQFSEELVADPARLSLIERITIRHDPLITARGRPFRHNVRVAVRLKDGTELATTIEKRLDALSFPDTERVLRKFRTLARHVLPDEQVHRLESMVMAIDELDDAKALSQLIAAPRS